MTLKSIIGILILAGLGIAGGSGMLFVHSHSTASLAPERLVNILKDPQPDKSALPFENDSSSQPPSTLSAQLAQSSEDSNAHRGLPAVAAPPAPASPNKLLSPSVPSFAGKSQTLPGTKLTSQRGTNSVPAPAFSSPATAALPTGASNAAGSIPSAASIPGSQGIQRKNIASVSTPADPNESVLVEVDPAAAGNSISSGDQRVAVESYEQGPGGGAIDLVIDPSPPPQKRSVQQITGFSYEEELFRTKWGWNAYDQAGRTGRQSAGGN